MSDADFAALYGPAVKAPNWNGGGFVSQPTTPPVSQADRPSLRSEYERDRFRSALQQIASADLKRCSAGWLQQIALEALQAHVDPLKPPHPSQAPETP